jgi:bifunctional UDP-N-acetylglucosamine pyrophosphorylase/glucosamine-1-phosphate N-acetyltransferase
MPPKYAVIPAAGEGKRIRPYSVKVPKPMIQVLGRPILAHVINRCKAAEIEHIIIVMNPDSTIVKDYFGDGTDFGVVIEYVHQPKPEGIGHAVGLTEGIVDTPFAVYLGDELYLDSDHTGFIQSFDGNRCAAAIGLLRVDNEDLIRKNYSVELDSDTHIVQDLVEKPTVITNNILGCGSYIFNETVFEAVKRTPRSKKNEIEITDTLNTIRKLGHDVFGYFLGGTYINITYPEDIPKAEELLKTDKDAIL